LSPIEQAEKFKDHGFKNLHIVDLDGALNGETVNLDIIKDIVGKINLDKLTQTARSEVEIVIEKSVKQKERIFIEFFNKAQPLNTRMHQLNLLPGIGKRHTEEIIERRDEKPFESFEDIKKRVKLMPDPEKTIVKRIFVELNNEDKHKLFV
jgi:putative nucleotide binding protein